MRTNAELMEMVKSGKATVYEIWESDSNDRSHFGNVISDSYDKVESWLIEHFIKPEYRDMVETDEMGISIISCDKDQCWDNLNEMQQNEYFEEMESGKDAMCQDCDQCQYLYFTAEEIDKPDMSDLDYETIFGSNEFYNLLGDQVEKKENTHKTLFNAWNISPEVGISALLLSDYTPEKALSPELLEKSKRDLEKAGLI